jgi:hypothetical protein
MGQNKHIAAHNKVNVPLQRASIVSLGETSGISAVSHYKIEYNSIQDLMHSPMCKHHFIAGRSKAEHFRRLLCRDHTAFEHVLNQQQSMQQYISSGLQTQAFGHVCTKKA